MGEQQSPLSAELVQGIKEQQARWQQQLAAHDDGSRAGVDLALDTGKDQLKAKWGIDLQALKDVVKRWANSSDYPYGAIMRFISDSGVGLDPDNPSIVLLGGQGHVAQSAMENLKIFFDEKIRDLNLAITTEVTHIGLEDDPVNNRLYSLHIAPTWAADARRERIEAFRQEKALMPVLRARQALTGAQRPAIATSNSDSNQAKENALTRAEHQLEVAVESAISFAELKAAVERAIEAGVTVHKDMPGQIVKFETTGDTSWLTRLFNIRSAGLRIWRQLHPDV